MIEIAGREVSQQISDAKFCRMSHLKRGAIIQRIELTFDRFNNTRTAVASIDTP